MKLTHLLTALTLAFATTEALAEKLVIKGSDTLGAKLVPQLAEQFKAQHPGTTFDIAAEGGWRDLKMVQRYTKNRPFEELQRLPTPLSFVLRKRAS